MNVREERVLYLVVCAAPTAADAEGRRAVNAPHLVALVRAGARFERGILVERREAQVA